MPAAPSHHARRIEEFHLCFLRVLETCLDRQYYVVKGGVNLRAWFGSPRYSEDLDLDVSGMGVRPVESRIDRAFAAPALRLMLEARGTTVSRISKPKQTDTTQRWKIEIGSRSHELPLHTKVELSRRGLDGTYALEPVLATIAKQHGIPPPSANHYDASSAVWQKVGALAGRRETQARDIWDLEHLFRTTGVRPEARPSRIAILQIAIDRVLELPFDAYRSQVVPYLVDEIRELYESSDAWDRIRERVLEELERLRAQP